jgi:acetylornithine/N-succinyldiaminopimelate aminotransferase
MSALIGHKIQESSKIQNLIAQLVDEVMLLSNPLGVIAAANQEFLENGKTQVDRAGKIRGRPLNYPYVGSGAGKGVYVELEDGSVKIDLINGIGIHLMGHSNPRILKACVRGAIADIVNQGNLQPNREYTVFLEKLVKLAGKRSRIKYGWLSTCGTMANENALKLTRQKHSPARMILGFSNAFAGRSTLMAELTDNNAYKVGLPNYDEVLRLPFYDKKNPQTGENTLRVMKEHVAKFDKNISTFVFEPMLGEGGYQAAPKEFFVPLLEFCKQQHSRTQHSRRQYL